MRDDPLHQSRRQPAPARLRPNIHAPQDALVPELGSAVHMEAGHAEQRRFVDPAAKHRAGLQAFGPPRGGPGGLVLPRSAERLGVVLQAFEAQRAIIGDVMRLETAYLEELWRDGGGVGLDHGFLYRRCPNARNGQKRRRRLAEIQGFGAASSPKWLMISCAVAAADRTSVLSIRPSGRGTAANLCASRSWIRLAGEVSLRRSTRSGLPTLRAASSREQCRNTGSNSPPWRCMISSNFSYCGRSSGAA